MSMYKSNDMYEIEIVKGKLVSVNKTEQKLTLELEQYDFDIERFLPTLKKYDILIEKTDQELKQFCKLVGKTVQLKTIDAKVVSIEQT